VYALGIVPSTHRALPFRRINIRVVCDGVEVHPADIVVRTRMASSWCRARLLQKCLRSPRRWISRSTPCYAVIEKAQVHRGSCQEVAGSEKPDHFLGVASMRGTNEGPANGNGSRHRCEQGCFTFGSPRRLNFCNHAFRGGTRDVLGSSTRRSFATVLHLFLRELGSRDCVQCRWLRLGRCKAASRNNYEVKTRRRNRIHHAVSFTMA